MEKLLKEQDIEVVELVHMIAKLPTSRNNLIDKLKIAMSEGNINDESVTMYVFLRFYEITKIIQAEDLKNSDLLNLIEICNGYMDKRNNNWWIHLLKCLIYLRVPVVFQNDDDLIQSIDSMLEAQKNKVNKEFYFIIPYVYRAIFYSNRLEFNDALESLKEGIIAVPKGIISIGNLSSHIYLPIREYRLNCKMEIRDREFKLIDDIVSIYFDGMPM